MRNFLWALVILIILGGGYFLWQSSVPSAAAPSSSTSTPASSPETPTSTPTPTPTPAPGTPTTATVIYNGDSFSPGEITIKKGGTVTWRNTSGGKLWVASAQHPSHTVYAGTSLQEHCPDTSGTAFDQCAGGGDYSFTFQKAGTWNYHDHLKAQISGKVIVVE